jgi:hypothetical protein
MILCDAGPLIALLTCPKLPTINSARLFFPNITFTLDTHFHAYRINGKTPFEVAPG